MKLATELYQSQQARWPARGRHILAQFDDGRVVVYQAYNARIGRLAADHGYFGGEFRLGRMSWVKPNFLWMMYRSGWGTKPDQEVTLAVHLKRAAFDELLRLSVHSSFAPGVYRTEEAWRAAVAASDVRLQWDPDHAPTGEPVARRAVQLGLRGDVLRRYAREWLLDVEDISDFVAEQRAHRHAETRHLLRTPREDVYPVGDPVTAARLGIERPDRRETG